MSEAAAQTGVASAQRAKDGFGGPFPLGTPAQMSLVVLQLFKSKAGGQARRLARSVKIAPSHVKIDPALLPPGGHGSPVGWRSVAETPAAVTRPAAAGTRLPR